MLSSPMPIRFGIACERCERIYLVAHPDRAKWILFAADLPLIPIPLNVYVQGGAVFRRTETLPYRVSEYICSQGYAERGEYEAIPQQRSKDETR